MEHDIHALQFYSKPEGRALRKHAVLLREEGAHTHAHFGECNLDKFKFCEKVVHMRGAVKMRIANEGLVD